MKTAFISAMLVALFVMAAMAQDVSTPRLVLFAHPSPSTTTSFQPNLPPIPAATLFYAGDFNCEDPNAQGFANENTLLVSDTETLGAISIPAGKQVLVERLFINTTSVFDDFDPETATWEIRTGVSEGNGGTQVASGSGRITTTGLSTCGAAIWAAAVTVTLAKPQTLSEGTYWFNVTPQCTNSGDSNCEDQEYFVDNTTQGTNNVRGHLQPLHEIYLNSSYFGYSYVNWCDSSLGQNAHQCAALSFGILGL